MWYDNVFVLLPPLNAYSAEQSANETIIDMSTKNDEKWLLSYRALYEYLSVNHQLPDKKKVENRGLLNWWKYNKRLHKEGKLTDERIRLLRQLNDLRSNKVLEF